MSSNENPTSKQPFSRVISNDSSKTISENKRSLKILSRVYESGNESSDSSSSPGNGTNSRALKTPFDKMGQKLNNPSPVSIQKKFSHASSGNLTISGTNSSSGSDTARSSQNKSKGLNASIPSAATPNYAREDSGSASPITPMAKKVKRILFNKNSSLGPDHSSRLMSHYRFSVFQPNIPQSPISAEKKEKFSVMNLLAMARRLGLMKRDFAYEQYISKEQYHMIKDVSTGKFDLTDDRREQQLEKLKSKVLFQNQEHNKIIPQKKRKKTTMLFHKETFTSVKHAYNKFLVKIRKVVTPNNKVMIMSDCVITVLILYDLIMVPFQIFFDVPLPKSYFIFEVIIDVCFFVDIMLNFNTGYYAKGLLVMDRKKIAWNYMMRWFWIDVLATIPFSYIFLNSYYVQGGAEGGYNGIRYGGSERNIRLIRAIRVFKLKKNFVKLESYVDFTPFMASIIGFIKLAIIILLIAHWLGCIWHFVSVLELENHPETWITRADELYSSWVDRYVTSIYWATMTMITVGYGDVTPVTRNEKIVAIMAMLVASGVFAYTMNRINVILAGLDTTSKQYKRALSTLSDYMKKKRVDKELQIKIKKYLEYALAVETSLDSNESALDVYLNQSLKDELITQVYGRILRENSIFKRFSSELISRASFLVKEKIYSPEDTIFLEYKHKDLNLYLINVGKVEIFHFYTATFFKTLLRGDHFGELAFFTGIQSEISARSVDFSTIYYIKREEFLSLLDDFPYEKDKFHEVKDMIGLYNDFRSLGAKCYSCEAETHSAINCPKIHLTFNRERYLKAYIESRNKFMREWMRTGSRTNVPARQNLSLAKAAKRIQRRVELGIYKGSKIRLPESEPDIENKEVMKRVSFQPGHFPIASTELFTPVGEQNNEDTPDALIIPENVREHLLALNTMGGTDQIQINYEVNKDAPRRISVVFTPMQPVRKSQKSPDFGRSVSTFKKVIMDNDIDRIQNYLYYFPHNNFSTLYPTEKKSLLSSKTTMFNFNDQTGTAKSTLKKFANILKNRMSVRKEANEALRKPMFSRSETKKRIGATTNKASRFSKELEKVNMVQLSAPQNHQRRGSAIVINALGDDADAEDHDNNK